MFKKLLSLMVILVLSISVMACGEKSKGTITNHSNGGGEGKELTETKSKETLNANEVSY